MNKNNFNIYYILKLLFLLILCLFILTGCSNNNDDKLKGKTQDQINYLEKDLISMLNGFNNISYANYRIEIKQETQSSQTNALIEESKKGKKYLFKIDDIITFIESSKKTILKELDSIYEKN